MQAFRFGIVSDPHIALPQTIAPGVLRFHQVEISIAALEQALEHLQRSNLDFLLIPGDLTQDGEPENHAWLSDRLAQLPFPCYVIPGNHDVPYPQARTNGIGLGDFGAYYQRQGYGQTDSLDYSRELAPGVRLIALKSNGFNRKGQQVGSLTQGQLRWLEEELERRQGEFIIAMIHHNVVEHLPGQSRHELGRRYMLSNARRLRHLLRRYGAKLILTGHLHVQDIAYQGGLYEITTGSLVSYPHPYRIVDCEPQREGWNLTIQSHRVESLADYPDLAHQSRQFLAERSYSFMMRLLTAPPLNLPPQSAEPLAKNLRYFWADVAAGDAQFHFPHFPAPAQRFLHQFNQFNHPAHLSFSDNDTQLAL